MVHEHTPEDDYLDPAFAGRFSQAPIPRIRLAEGEAPAETVYRLIHDELLLDGSSRLDMATFVTTWMESQAERLMAEAFDKDTIDKDEYPQTAEIERRCANIVADLFHAPTGGDAVTSTLPAVVSWLRSCTPTWHGISGCRRSSPSTCRGTSTS